MNRMIGVGLACTSSITDRRRCSNSPFMLAPACNSPRSSMNSLFPCNFGGTSPEAKRWAKPSTTAVLPTPASPVRIGLFWRRRSRMSMIWRISSSRPTIGSIFPLAATSVMSTANRASAVVPPTPPAAAPPPAARPTPVPSIGRMSSSSLSFHADRASDIKLSTLISLKTFEICASFARVSLSFRTATKTWPVRICASANIKVA